MKLSHLVGRAVAFFGNPELLDFGHVQYVQLPREAAPIQCRYDDDQARDAAGVHALHLHDPETVAYVLLLLRHDDTGYNMEVLSQITPEHRAAFAETASLLQSALRT